MREQLSIQQLEQAGWRHQLRTDDMPYKGTDYILISPDGYVFADYDSWQHVKQAYDQGYIVEGDGIALPDHGNHEPDTPTELQVIWDGSGSNYSDPYALFPWIYLVYFAITLIIGLTIIGVMWKIESILHPCPPSDVAVDGDENKRYVTTPTCDKYVLDLITGDTKKLVSNDDWLQWVIIGVVVIAGIWLISESGILKGAGSKASGWLGRRFSGGGGGGGPGSQQGNVTYTYTEG